MWSNYTKTFAFRDCFDRLIIDGNVSAIQELLSVEQCDKTFGANIYTDTLSVSALADDFGVYASEDDGTWTLCFYRKEQEICAVNLWDIKEIHLMFDIEEEIGTGKIKIHGCKVEGFKEYQR